MTGEQIARIVAEFERRWRERTPARSVLDALPTSKVPWSEVLAIKADVTGEVSRNGVDDRLDLNPAIQRTLRRLRREFPDLQW